MRPRSPGWRTAGPQLIPALALSPHQPSVGRWAQAATEASPFRQFPAPATEERRVEERLASLMVIRPDVWLRCQAVSSMFDVLIIPNAIELDNVITRVADDFNSMKLSVLLNKFCYFLDFEIFYFDVTVYHYVINIILSRNLSSCSPYHEIIHIFSIKRFQTGFLRSSNLYFL